MLFRSDDDVDRGVRAPAVGEAGAGEAGLGLAVDGDEEGDNPRPVGDDLDPVVARVGATGDDGGVDAALAGRLGQGEGRGDLRLRGREVVERGRGRPPDVVKGHNACLLGIAGILLFFLIRARGRFSPWEFPVLWLLVGTALLLPLDSVDRKSVV